MNGQADQKFESLHKQINAWRDVRGRSLKQDIFPDSITKLSEMVDNLTLNTMVRRSMSCRAEPLSLEDLTSMSENDLKVMKIGMQDLSENKILKQLFDGQLFGEDATKNSTLRSFVGPWNLGPSQSAS